MSARTLLIRSVSVVAMAASIVGCASVTSIPAEVRDRANLTPPTPTSRDLFNFPAPAGKVAVAVYGFRDQTGQYKPAPDSSFSTAVTQGATSMLVKSLKDSGWFIPVERENLQNLLTERKIVRALETPQPNDAPKIQVPSLLSASILVEGGIVAYESNVRSGGAGAKFLGVGISTLYRVDQVTVNLRSVDIRSGEILHSVSTTKTIYSYEVRPSVFKFVNVKDLVEVEAGVTRNEPSQLCVSEAIEAGVAHLIAQGIKSRAWVLKNQNDMDHPILKKYLQDQDTYYGLHAAMLTEAMGEDGPGTKVSSLNDKGATITRKPE